MMLRSTTVRQGVPPGEDVLVDARVCDCCPTTAVRTSTGVVAAYRDRSEGEMRDISVARLVQGRWQSGGFVHADGWRIEGCPVNGPALASAGDLVALAWFTAANDVGRVSLAFSRDGGASFGAPIQIDDGRPLGRVDVEMLPDGSAVVLWLERRDGGGAVQARRVGPDGRRGPATELAAFPRSSSTTSEKRRSGEEAARQARAVTQRGDAPPPTVGVLRPDLGRGRARRPLPAAPRGTAADSTKRP